MCSDVSEYRRALAEDMAEFREAYQIERKGKYAFVPGRMITLPGMVLIELERRKMIEGDGLGGYRPKRQGRS